MFDDAIQIRYVVNQCIGKISKLAFYREVLFIIIITVLLILIKYMYDIKVLKQPFSFDEPHNLV